jgi:ABC-2 type transport system ATP-binding protein
VLVTEALVKSYGRVRTLHGFDLQVPEGEITGLIGPDGAGKTTVMRLLTGLLRPDSGRVLIDSEETTARRPTGGRIGYMPQRFSLYPDLSVDENLRFYAHLFGVRGALRRERTARLLDFARLEPFRRRRAAALSGGMKQKLALACTLVHAPRILLLDEPTTGVDPVSRAEFWDILMSLRGEGSALLVSTPYMDEADRCDRIVFLREGRVLDRGTPAELRARCGLRVVEVDTPDLARVREALSRQPWIRDVVPFGTRLHVTLTDRAPAPGEIGAAVRADGLPVTDLRPVPPSLEDIFITLATTGEEA